MNNSLRKSIFDSTENLRKKTEQIDNYIQISEESLIAEEIKFINALVRKLEFLLPIDDFSCKKGVLLYSFKHGNDDREVFISSEVYLIDSDCVVYEVINPKKYSQVSSNDILISKNNKYFCEIQLKDFLKYVSPEEIYAYLDKYINEDFDELSELQKRQEFIKGIYNNK